MQRPVNSGTATRQENHLHHRGLCARQRPKKRKTRPLSDLGTPLWAGHRPSGPGAGSSVLLTRLVHVPSCCEGRGGRGRQLPPVPGSQAGGIRHRPQSWARTCPFNVSILVTMETQESRPGTWCPFIISILVTMETQESRPGTWCPFNVSILVTMETRQSGQGHALSMFPCMSLWKPESGRGHALSTFPSVSPWKPGNQAWNMVPFQCFHACHHGNSPIWAETCPFNVSIRVTMETQESGLGHGALSMFPSVSPWKPANLG
uniref:Uncharacterized protein n=1 Tax=Myotis myotis TaxID=51298 RepID=A0A7J7V3P1_MYOMY|nr:hypothetical protein mMyoMyo1_008421 [Myotis myotis]